MLVWRGVRWALVMGIVAMALLRGGGMAAAQPAPTPNLIVVGPGEDVVLDASRLLPGALWYDWDFGDGSYTLGAATITHTYQYDGLYRPRVNAVTPDRRDFYADFLVIVDSNPNRAIRWAGARFAGFEVGTGRPVIQVTVARINPATGLRFVTQVYMVYDAASGFGALQPYDGGDTSRNVIDGGPPAAPFAP